jgi:hypothetical protein
MVVLMAPLKAQMKVYRKDSHSARLKALQMETR